MSIVTRPIVTWPGKMTPRNERLGKRYNVNGGKVRDELLRELDAIGARDAFIQAAYAQDQIRIDGLPRSGALPAHPGIILTYSTKAGTFQLPCDTFADAEQNLRAICLTLQRLRLIEETGVKTHGRQYEGFRQLPPPANGARAAGQHAAMSVEEAVRTIFQLAGLGCEVVGIPTPEAMQSVYRAAAKNTHPDTNPAKAEDFQLLQSAKTVIDEHFYTVTTCAKDFP